MFNNKYNKALTIILIVVIIVIVGLLIFFGIDMYQKYYIEKETGKVVEEFEDHINKISEPVEDNNNIITNTVTPDVNINDIYQNNDNDSDSNSDVTYMGYTVIGTIEIPAIDIKYLIIPDDEASLNSLNVAIVKLYPIGTGLNEVGNAVFAGHNYRNGTFFSNNKRLQNGDKIYITDLTGERVEYEIYKKYTTGTGDSTYMNRDTEGRREISLTTCTDDTTQRLIIWAKEVEN